MYERRGALRVRVFEKYDRNIIRDEVNKDLKKLRAAGWFGVTAECLRSRESACGE